MTKSFDELRKIDVTSKTKQLNGYPYLPWQECLNLLRENGAEDVAYDCTSVLWIQSYDKRQALVKVEVTIGDKTRSITHPVALGEFSTDEPTSRQIEAAIQRAFVKCVAINWGLGLGLWDKDVDAAPIPADNNIAVKVTMAFGAKVPEFGSAEALHKALGTDKAFLAKLLNSGSKEDQQAFLEKIQAL